MCVATSADDVMSAMWIEGKAMGVAAIVDDVMLAMRNEGSAMDIEKESLSCRRGGGSDEHR